MSKIGTREYTVSDFHVEINMKSNQTYEIIKIELYNYDLQKHFDITSQRCDKLDAYLREDIGEQMREEEEMSGDAA